MSKKEQSIIAVFVVIIAMLMIVLFMQMSVINECWGLHDDLQEYAADKLCRKTKINAYTQNLEKITGLQSGFKRSAIKV